MIAAEPEQQALEGLEACRVKFTGMSIDEITEPPALDDVMEFKVRATCCVEPSKERLRTGELRVTAKMRVESVEVVIGPTAPDNGPNLRALDDQDDQ